MAQHRENDYIIPVLLVLYGYRDGCYMDIIKDKVSDYIGLSEEDLVPYQSRNPSEPRYRQIVGNLISHTNPELFQYIEMSIEDKKTKYILNKSGISFVENNLLSIKGKELGSAKNDAILNDFGVTNPEKNSNDQKIIKIAETKGIDKRPPSDMNVHSVIADMYGHKCQYATFIGEEHQTFIGSDGKPYMVIHHIIPMSARKDFFPKNLDVATNLVCLCPNCHERIHHGNNDEKREILKVLYDNYIRQLNSDGLYIGFETLLKKYY